jgi:ketopantoate hydroxymethyltransferase
VKKYLDLGVLIRDAVARYNDEVKHGTFPGPEHSFAAEKEAGKSATVLQLYSSVK